MARIIAAFAVAAGAAKIEREDLLMSVRKQLAGAMAAGLLVLLSGCTGFFPPLTSNSGGGSGSGSGTGDFVYVANTATQSIAGFAVSTSSTGAGALTVVSGSPYALPQQPTAMVITPSNSFLYVGALGGIYGFAINTTTGVLSAVSSGGVLATTILGSASLDVSPDGQWLFALDEDGSTLEEFQINNTTGALGVFAQITYTGAGGVQASPKMVKVAPNGAYVFLALGTGGDQIYTLTTSTGALSTSPSQSLSTGSATTSDNALAINSGTTFLYIARSGGSNGVAVFPISTTGLSSAVAGSPFASGQGPFSVLLDGTGKYAYAGNRTDGTLSGYSIGTNGALTPLSGSPYTSGNGVNSLARDNSGKYVLATAGGGSPDLTMYSFDATTAGKLDSAATAATGSDPTAPIMVVATH